MPCAWFDAACSYCAAKVNEDDSSMSTGLAVVIICVLLLTGGTLSGLNIGLMSLTVEELERLEEGAEQVTDRKYVIASTSY
jgi:hypothetical protein